MQKDKFQFQEHFQYAIDEVQFNKKNTLKHYKRYRWSDGLKDFTEKLPPKDSSAMNAATLENWTP